MVDRVESQLLLRAVSVETDGQETELLTPITQVVDTVHIPTLLLVQVGQETTNDGGSQVTGVEWLSDVWRGELDNNLLTLARDRGTVVFTLG
ncbi:hypothetical protein WICPIJ_002439 [Wickerhamomyces pijperi]|uniref:Uncharacterized protein n=1 Tax=Wickerhamomyces pijperi TaxID=599730 RepID=A0A9P8QBH3_WICPI|nr:hypothetical protein WICPIJ_002439 [Wickerhamomyces pijperi]